MLRVLLLCGLAALPLGADSGELFESRIRPLLARNCFACHTSAHLGGLTLSSRRSLIQGGASGPAIVPGKPDASLLVQAIRQTHPRLKMPPTGKLKPEEIRDIEVWISEGAPWPENSAASPIGKDSGIRPEQRQFWSFRPVGKPAIPAVRNAKWVKSPIDAFILSKLEAMHLAPVAPADRRTLIRRATLDLHGIPPTPAEVSDFLNDKSPDAFAHVVDRLLASPRYGERWGRYWLDVARYSDDQLDATQDRPLANAFRYRDWVVEAFNRDLPYDQFIKAQIAGDLMPDAPRQQMVAGLGFYALSPSAEFHEDRVDATTRGFLGLTAACAECHDHKYDPIPTKDYYGLLGVFENTEYQEIPLVSQEQVDAYQRAKKEFEDQQAAFKKFLDTERRQLLTMLANETARYMVAAWRVLGPAQLSASAIARDEALDEEVLLRWIAYLKQPAEPRQHAFLNAWDGLLRTGGTDEQCRKIAGAFETEVLQTLAQKETIDEENVSILAESKYNKEKEQAVLSLPRDRFALFSTLADAPGKKQAGVKGVLYFSDQATIVRLSGLWKEYAQNLRKRVEELKAKIPPEYPYLRVIRDKAKPVDLRVYIGGDKENLGELAPRHFLSVLCDGTPPLFHNGSGRMELANAIADARNPLTARVMVNRIWEHHFGYGIVRTPGNFGQLGERPTHPELLDFLAGRFVENGWSIKAMQREIMLSSTYALSSEYSKASYQVDPDNKLLWRANTRRLDWESLRDSLLFVAGNLDTAVGGPPVEISDPANKRRTLYGSVSRRHLDPLLRLFDFPDPNSSSDERLTTNIPLQQLFFLNSDFVTGQAASFAQRLAGSDTKKIRLAYVRLYSREPSTEEIKAGLEYLRSGGMWPRYAKVLLSSNEFCFLR